MLCCFESACPVLSLTTNFVAEIYASGMHDHMNIITRILRITQRHFN